MSPTAQIQLRSLLLRRSRCSVLSRLALLPRSMAMQGAKVMINDLKKGVSKGAGAVDAGTRDGDNQEARLVSDGDG